MDYTALPLVDVRSALEKVAGDAQTTFGALTAPQLNWRPDASRWSIAQCFQHLVTSNDLMLDAARSALADRPTSVWQRMPVLSGFFG